MFRNQANALYGLDVGTQSDDVATLRRDIATSFERLTQLIASCGQIDHDTDGKTFSVNGYSPDTAGISGDHAIFQVDQYNPLAGTESNPNLYAAIFNGPSKFNGQVIFAGDNPPEGVIRIATAINTWVNNVHPAIPTVTATDDESGDVVVIRLYRTSPSLDPNVRNGYKVMYFLDVDGNPVATGGYADDKIGMIKTWNSTVATIPGGWKLCNGANGTTDLRDRFIVGASQDDAGVAKTNVTGALTISGGAATHVHALSGSTGNTAVTISGSTSSEVVSIAMSGNTATGGSTTHNHTDPTNGAGNTGSYTISINDHTGGTTQSNSPDLTISVASSKVALDAGGVDVVTYPAASTIDVNNDPHVHNLNTIIHSGTGVGAAHFHAIANADISHQHGYGTLAATATTHSHSAGTLAGASHSHSAGTLAADSSSHLPPYYSLCYIQRVD